MDESEIPDTAVKTEFRLTAGIPGPSLITRSLLNHAPPPPLHATSREQRASLFFEIASALARDQYALAASLLLETDRTH
jgi:hypothetical protein